MPDAHTVQMGLAFNDAFSRESFLFSHNLHRPALYDVQSLVSLARRVGPHQAYWSSRPPELADGWEHAHARERSLEAAVAGIERSNVRVTLQGIEQDPVFGPVFAPVVAEVAAKIATQLRDDLVRTRCALVITSPRRMIDYHIDASAKFLLQLRGDRRISVFDGSSRLVVPESELEAFYAGNPTAARYKEDQQGTPRMIVFQPGSGLHVPVEWPHWLKNGNSLSVALRIQYELRSTRQRAQLYRANHRLRQLGISPAPPGRSHWRDVGKAALVAGLDRLRHHAS